MNYEEALQLQSACQFLIGRKGKYNRHPISDIFVLPIGNEKIILERILTNTGLCPKQIAKSYNAKEYVVAAIYEIEGKHIFEDITIYIDQKIKS